MANASFISETINRSDCSFAQFFSFCLVLCDATSAFREFAIIITKMYPNPFPAQVVRWYASKFLIATHCTVYSFVSSRLWSYGGFPWLHYCKFLVIVLSKVLCNFIIVSSLWLHFHKFPMIAHYRKFPIISLLQVLCDCIIKSSLWIDYHKFPIIRLSQLLTLDFHERIIASSQLLQ